MNKRIHNDTICSKYNEQVLRDEAGKCSLCGAKIENPMDTIFTMGIDQYGQHYDDLGNYPRKALCERLGYKSAQKMYIDTQSGETKHIGYIIGGLWITLYSVSEWSK